MKTCNRCSKTKSLTEFYKRLDKESRCKECVSEIRKAKYAEDPQKVIRRVAKYRTENPEKIRDTKLKQAYGVGLDYFNAKLEEQGGVCAVCGLAVKTVWRGKEVNMPLDHDHTTLEPRGILCSNHNRALGLLNENIAYMQNMIAYVSKYKKLG